jgi:hypothetical protein
LCFWKLFLKEPRKYRQECFDKENVGLDIPEHIQLLLELHHLERADDSVDTKERCQHIEALLDPSLLKRYRAVKKKRRTGIAILKNRTCDGCRMVFPDSHEVFRYGTFVHTCEFCGRLLVVLESDGSPTGESVEGTPLAEKDEEIDVATETDDVQESDDEMRREKASSRIKSGSKQTAQGKSSVHLLGNDPSYDEILWEMLQDSDSEDEETEDE